MTQEETRQRQEAIVSSMVNDIEAHMMNRVEAGLVPEDWGPEEYKWWMHGVVRHMFGCKPERHPERFKNYMEDYKRRML